MTSDLAAHYLEETRRQMRGHKRMGEGAMAQMQSAIQVCLDDTADKEPDTWLEVVNWVRQATQAIDADPDKLAD